MSTAVPTAEVQPPATHLGQARPTCRVHGDSSRAGRFLARAITGLRTCTRALSLLPGAKNDG